MREARAVVETARAESTVWSQCTVTVSNERTAPGLPPALRARMIHRATGDEVAVYRFYDANDRLLYVGISKDPMNRWQEHMGRRWWADVVSYEVRWHPSRADARTEEKRAMADEDPVYNIHSAPRHGAHWRAALAAPEAQASRAARRSANAKREASDG